MPKRVKLDEFHYHEALHTASVLMETFSTHVAEHPAVTQDKALEKLAEEAVSAMYAAYNAISLARLDKFEPGWRTKKKSKPLHKTGS